MSRLQRLIVVGLFFCILGATDVGAQEARPPNVVLILADDLGYGDLGVTGAPDIRTPNLDGLAAEGVRFTRAYANAPVCTPTRVAILSGQYQQRTGTDRVIYVNEREEGLSLDVVLLPALLKEVGYATGIFGKWHLGFPTRYFPTRRGFDAFTGFLAGNVDYFAHTDRLGNHDLWRGEEELVDDRYMTDLVTDEALAFVDRHQDEPFFLYVPYSAPHDPFQGPEHRATAGDREVTMTQNRTRAVFESRVESMDANVGRLLQRIDELGLREHTVVFFMSDNGGLPIVARNAPYSGHKRFLWEGGIRAPLLARWPGHFPAGVTTGALAAGMDLFPTILDITGAPRPTSEQPVDGVSLLSVLRDGDGQGHRALFFHYDDPGLDPQRALVDEEGWKYLLDAEGEEHLFDLRADPGEQHDRAAEASGRLTAMREAYEAWLGEVRPDRHEGIAHLQGEMAGEVTAAGVILQSRLTAPAVDEHGDVPGAEGVARFEISAHPGFLDGRRTEWVTADSSDDFIVKQMVEGLQPNTRYHYRLIYGPDRQHPAYGPARSFRTLPAPDDPAPASFVVVTGMHYGKFHKGPEVDAAEKPMGFPAMEAIRALRPDFFVGTGDNVYYDHDPDVHSLPALRKKWHEQFVQPRSVRLFSEVPTYWEKDDHDYRYNDADTTGDRPPSHRLGMEVFREQVPVTDPGDPDEVTYRTHRIGALVQIWLLEGRDYRSPNLMPDGPEKTVWGEKQRAWLQETLLASTAPFKIVISPTPMVGPDDAYKKDNHTNPEGFRHEGAEFFAWARENGMLEKGLYLICGDRHWQYHSIHPSGFEEFSTGALVDANARLGRDPGDPASTDPQALIRQPYTSSEPSGGFLHVAVEPDAQPGSAAARFEFFDEKGNMLYSVRKTAAR